MGFDDDFFDDFDDDFNELDENSNDPIEEIPGAGKTPDGDPIEIMMLYDEGSLKEVLLKYIQTTEFVVIEAHDIASAKLAMQEHPDLGIIVSNSTVAGVDAASILKQLVVINPDLICIICTDMIDLLAFQGLINTSPIYKILTFPLDIDKELIPALSEVTATSMVRKVKREDWDTLVSTNTALKKELDRLKHLSTIQHGGMRKVYAFLNEILVDNINELCKKVSQETRDKLIAFQKNVVDHFFLSLSPKQDSLETYVEQLKAKFAPEGSGKTIKIKIENGTEANPLLKAKASFILWLLIYRLSLYENSFFVTANVAVRASDLAFIDLTYRLDEGVWEHMNANGLQGSYTKAVEGLVESFVNEYHKDASEVGDTISYHGSIALETE